MTPERFSRLRAALARRQPDLTVLMDSVNKSHNVSAILRTADAVAPAAGAILLEAERQRRAAGMYDQCRLAPGEFERTLFEWCYPDIAARCRELTRAYPPLSADGSLTVNPLLAP